MKTPEPTSPSRRQFPESSLATGAGLTIMPGGTLASSPKHELSTALIGASPDRSPHAQARRCHSLTLSRRRQGQAKRLGEHPARAGHHANTLSVNEGEPQPGAWRSIRARGRGQRRWDSLDKENVAALCGVDSECLGFAKKRFPKAWSGEDSRQCIPSIP